MFKARAPIVDSTSLLIMATPSGTDDHHQFNVPPIETDYYKLLQVERDASNAEIKSAYKKLSLQYHPDKTLDSETEGMMKQLNEAKSVLLDEGSRAEYDDKLEEEGAVPDPKGFLPTGKHHLSKPNISICT